MTIDILPAFKVRLSNNDCDKIINIHFSNLMRLFSPPRLKDNHNWSIAKLIQTHNILSFLDH